MSDARDNKKKKQLMKSLVKHLYILHDDSSNPSGFEANVYNTIRIIDDLYTKVFPEEHVNIKQLRNLETFLTQTNKNPGCIDPRIDQLSNFTYEGDYVLDKTQPFIMNLVKQIRWLTKELCKTGGKKDLELDSFIARLCEHKHFQAFVKSCNRAYEQIGKELESLQIPYSIKSAHDIGLYYDYKGMLKINMKILKQFITTVTYFLVLTLSIDTTERAGKLYIECE